MELIIKVIRKNTWFQTVGGGLLCLTGSVIVLINFQNISDNSGLFFTGLGVALFMLGLFFAISCLLKLKTSRNQLIKILQNNPKKVVWYYAYIVENMPFGVRVLQMSTIFIFFVDGKHTTLRVSKKETSRVMQALSELLPHATKGYSVEREQLFKANPRMLYKD